MTDHNTKFADILSCKPLLKALADLGYESPTPIQAQSLPELLNGRDLLGQAQTGTGKTAAFALPMLASLDLDLKQPQVLVLAPTRELANQVAEAFRSYAKYLKGFNVLTVYGGQSMHAQLKELKRGAHVVVGTPGRVMDHLRRKTLKLSHLKGVVLDEADEMLNMGFIDDIEWILEQAPAERQTALFSATMPRQIRTIAHQHLRNPVEVTVASQRKTVDTVEQTYCMIKGLSKTDVLHRILEVEEFDGAIVFARTKSETSALTERLMGLGYKVATLNGDMTQQLRERTVEQVKSGRIDIVVATDVAARGLDVPRITHVFNYDLPDDSEAYTHRIGRTGRAGRSGKSISFAYSREIGALKRIEKGTRQQMDAYEMPTEEELTERRLSQFQAKLADALSHQDLAFFKTVLKKLSESSECDLDELAAALLYMAQKDQPLKVKLPPQLSQQKRDTKQPTSKNDKKQSEHGPRTNEREYRVDVGRKHGIRPGDILGAFLNEGGLDKESVGRIQLFDKFSLVTLPARLPDAQFKRLSRLRVRQHALRLRVNQPFVKKPKRR